jgi:hypothetical protein
MRQFWDGSESLRRNDINGTDESQYQSLRSISVIPFQS